MGQSSRPGRRGDKAIDPKGKKMIRNLKVLGLALTAVLAVGAVMAASASAKLGHLTEANGAHVSVFGHGSDTGEGDAFHALGNEVTCTTDTFTVGKVNGTKPAGVHEALTLPAASATVTAHYSGCKLGAETATVTMNGCDYVFHFTTGKTDLVCPAGKVVEIHRYSSAANHTAGTSNCTTTVFPENGLGTVTYTNTPAGDITIDGTVTGVNAQSHGACSFGFTINDAEADYTVLGDIVGAEDAAEKNVDVHIG